MLLSTMAILAASAASAADLGPFNRIELTGEVTMLIEPGERAEVRVLSPLGVAQRTHLEVSDGVLYVAAPPQEGVELAVRLPELKEVLSRGQATVLARNLSGRALVLDSRGAGAFELTAVDVQELSLVGAGTSRFRVSGHAERQVIDLDGAGSVAAHDLDTRSSEVRVRGAGEVMLQAREHLAVDVAGMAKVTYSGNPVIARQVRGVGIVQAVR